MKYLQRHQVLRYLTIVAALELVAVSINFFYAPAKVAAGGATGLAILTNQLFGFDRAIVVLVVNVLMIILAAVFLDRGTTARIAFGSFVLPILLKITPSGQVLTDRTFAVLVGGTIFAVGLALLYRVDASSGGTAVPPMILKKYFRIAPAFSLLVIDTVVSLGNIATGGIEPLLLALFSLMITAVIMNYIETGLDRRKMVYITSNNNIEGIKNYLSHNETSFTSLDVRGGYTGDGREMLMVILDNQDYNHLLRGVHLVDPQAFMIAYDISEAHGGTFI
ncbi:YitT family protein [Leuconostoc carnosum]|uniref:YitT family protein n=2 Tax=Leuconostoc carnosum TaxID=1252 RepID=K0D5U5_LEUCJ|nr:MULTISPECIES: YitT family protein [Leuconostoc]AFT81224.1 YitT family protein [Leuconostoc carnosum JB16]KAA8330555.1 YitT family protein [Leuconostoc carnosum]KAA8362117.1 YitT family protein [Leuconostoc carnosum]KAA8366666.1 YitT family protein [Leuconostoc carnosum]KAA8368201.1 YitT family protein [Leuconostoc carnosum]